MRARLRPWGVDGVVAIALFLGAAAIASWYVPQYAAEGGEPRFYQEEFGAAAMQACGHGFVNPDPASSAALEAFLAREHDEVSCHELAGAPTGSLRPMQRAFRYLMLAVAGTWRIQGEVAWSALTPLYALLFGTTIALAYGIFRQGMGLALSAGLAALLAVSTLQLNNLPHLRDFAKAPFVLALVLLAARLVLGAATPRRTLALAAGAGAVIGVGMGFRNDVLVAIPAFIGLLMVFLPGRPRQQILLRLAAVAVFLAVLLATMYPMLRIYTTGGGSSSQHLVLLGLTPAFSRDLGVDNSRLYEWGFEYRDELALAMIGNYADRYLGRHGFVTMYGADYDRAGTRLLGDIAADFPADMLARAYASAVRITELPYSRTTSALLPPAHVGDTGAGVFAMRVWLVRQLETIWPWAFLLTLAAVSLSSLRLGLFGAALVAYLSAYPALQFQERHFFHLEFIAWWVLGFALSLVAAALWTLRKGDRAAFLAHVRPADGWRVATRRAAAMWCAIAVVVLTPLWLARHFQQDRTPQLLGSIAAASRAEVEIVLLPIGDGRVRLQTPSLASGFPPDDGVHAVYLAVEVGGPACDLLEVPMVLRYQAHEPTYDFSHQMVVRTPLIDEPTQVFVPAYFRSPHSTDPALEPFGFLGVEVDEAGVPCLARVSAVEDASPFPVLMEVRLPPDWEHVTPFATITGVEGRRNPHEVYAFPADLPRRAVQQHLAATPVPFRSADVSKVSPTLVMNETGWRVSGVGGVGGRGPLLYLVEMQPRRLARHSAFIAEGVIEKGGVTFGLVRDGEWAVQLHVRRTGPFSVVIDVPEDGEYKVVMANNLLDMSLENRVTVSRAGLVAADGSTR